jgi:hypothetical protein
MMPRKRVLKAPGKAQQLSNEVAKSILCVMHLDFLCLKCCRSVVRNGDTSGDGIRLVLAKRNALSFDQVLEQINARIHLTTGALRKVCCDVTAAERPSSA